MAARLVMQGIAKRFGATAALSGVDLAIEPGEVLALIGENGAGKSTLMKILAGVYRADQGAMHLDGVPFIPSGPIDARRRGLAIVYQELTLAIHLSVEENITLGDEPQRHGWIDRPKRRELAASALAQLGCEHITLTALVRDLSIAQQQLVEIARALSAHPRLLVMDEPTSSLTRADVEHLMAVIRRLRGQGVSIIYISHFLEECSAIADRYAVLRDGRSVASGAMPAVSEAELIRHMVGRDVSEIYPRVPHALGLPVLEVNRVSGLGKPKQASLALHRGEILGIFGLVGSGRSEMLRVVFGLDPIRSGEIVVHGVPRTRSTPTQRLTQGIGLVSENRKEEGLLLNLSIADNLTLTRLEPYTHFGMIASRSQETSTRTWMERLGVRAQGATQAIAELSGGNQQKIAIGRLLHHGADILLLDEPTRGIDVNAKAQVYRLIGELAAVGTAVIVVSSYIPELLGICDSVAVMCRGQLGASRPVAEWDQHSILAAAIGQESSDHATT